MSLPILSTFRKTVYSFYKLTLIYLSKKKQKNKINFKTQKKKNFPLEQPYLILKPFINLFSPFQDIIYLFESVKVRPNLQN